METSVLHFVGTCEDSFLFEEAPSDMEEDTFRISNCNLSNCWIQSKEQKFLILRDSGSLDVQDLNLEERQQSECRFNIQYYLSTNKETTRKRPVILYALKNDQKVAVCCHDDQRICSQAMDLPKNIDEANHRALFYRTKVSTNLCMFESSVYRGRFLAFEPLEKDRCLYKLVLRHKFEDEPDEPCQVIVSQV